jgi:glycosyltransferase involved in cell wall biosynthesis
MITLLIIAWTLLALSAAGFVFWVILAYRVDRSMRPRPTILAGLEAPPPPGDPKVSIVVPVHNEEEVIDACARSLREQQYGNLEIIFVLDRCTDGTAAILARHAAEDERIVLIENESCPDDWAGKCNAARRGAERAGGDWLVFTDADTTFHPDLVRAAAALASQRGIALLSLLSTLTFEHAYERIAQPVASMNLIRMYPIERVNRPRSKRSRPFANGQFMLFDRAAYEAIGGHAAVKDDLLEDIAFARRIHAHGGQCGVFLADGMLKCRMYDSLAAFQRGWKRIFIEACKRKPKRLWKNALIIFVFGVGLPLVQAAALVMGIALAATDRPLTGGALIVVTLLGWAVKIPTVVRIFRLGGAPAAGALFYPVGCWIVGWILMDAARDLVRGRPIAWGGRQYVLQPRY